MESIDGRVEILNATDQHEYRFKKYDDKPLIDAIISSKLKIFRPGGQDSPVELILGILPSGASYLLMSNEQMLQFTTAQRIPPPRRPWKATNFLSLSPIYFHSTTELAAKIATYKQRPRNKNRREHEASEDNSQANRGYVKLGPGIIHYRGYFEQQRTLYRLLTRDLEPTKVGLAPPSWLGNVRVLSLVFAEWSVDDRRRNERLDDPRLVQVGWTDSSFPSFFESLTGATVHLKLNSSHVKMANPVKPHLSEVVEDNHTGLYARLRGLFDYDRNMPVIVLVHDEEMARSILSRAGVRVGGCPSGLSHLLPLAAVEGRYKVKGDAQPATLPEPSFVDTQKLVKALMEIDPGESVAHSAKTLRMQTDTRTCAGDDSLLQLRMWLSMVQGPAIDEQRKQRLSEVPACARVLAPPVEVVEVDSKDMDPNDIDPNDMPCIASRPTVDDDFSDDDDDW